MARKSFAYKMHNWQKLRHWLRSLAMVFREVFARFSMAAWSPLAIKKTSVTRRLQALQVPHGSKENCPLYLRAEPSRLCCIQPFRSEVRAIFDSSHPHIDHHSHHRASCDFCPTSPVWIYFLFSIHLSLLSFNPSLEHLLNGLLS